MRIGIFTDIRFTALATPTGVTKHIIQMVNGLSNHPAFEVILLVTIDQNKNGIIQENNALSHLPVRILPYSWHRTYWQGLIFNSPKYDKYTDDLDFIYCPKNDFIPLRNCNYVATIHGAHELDPDYPNSKTLIQRLQALRSRSHYKRILNQAKIVFTVSEFLKDKTIQWFNVNPEKILVIGNGVEEEFFSRHENPKHFPNGFLLAVGGLNYLDGGDRIIELAKILKKNDPNREIHIAGNQHESEFIRKAAKLPNIKILGYLNKTQLADTMSKATALVFLTRYETFGIAATEAMATGLPVITMKSTAVPEIVGDAGYYVTNLEQIVQIIADKKTLDFLREKGKERSRDFHWSSCVDRLSKAFIDYMECFTLSSPHNNR
jgi:glycosyltransferase involved in cell wall biosynthesis